MLLQVALDRPQDLSLTTDLSSVVDIIEVGTRVIKQCGIAAIRAVRESAPNTRVLADMKIADGGKAEVELAVSAGADMVTVLAQASRSTLADVVDVCSTRGLGLEIDTLGDSSLVDSQYVGKLLGGAYLLVHVPIDAQSKDKFPVDAVLRARENGYRVAVAGGLKLDTLREVLTADPQIVIVGKAITAAPDPIAAVNQISSLLHEYAQEGTSDG